MMVNGCRGLGGWAGPFLDVPVSGTPWSGEDGRMGGEAADARSGEDQSFEGLSADNLLKKTKKLTVCDCVK